MLIIRLKFVSVWPLPVVITSAWKCLHCFCHSHTVGSLLWNVVLLVISQSLLIYFPCIYHDFYFFTKLALRILSFFISLKILLCFYSPLCIIQFSSLHTLSLSLYTVTYISVWNVLYNFLYIALSRQKWILLKILMSTKHGPGGW